jgi:predicted transposase YdaD
LNQYKPVQDWKAIALFAQRRFEVTALTIYQQELINSGRIIPIYLDEVRSGSIGVGLIQLILAQDVQAPVLVQQLLERAKTEISDPLVTCDIIDLLETVLVSKFAQLSREEIQAMFLLSDIKQTRVYQEAKQEGRQEGERAGEARLVLRLLSKRFGKIDDRRVQVINSLTLEQLEDLGEALLDFCELRDLDNWLGFQIGE